MYLPSAPECTRIRFSPLKLSVEGTKKQRSRPCIRQVYGNYQSYQSRPVRAVGTLFTAMQALMFGFFFGEIKVPLLRSPSFLLSSLLMVQYFLWQEVGCDTNFTSSLPLLLSLAYTIRAKVCDLRLGPPTPICASRTTRLFF